MKPSHGCTVIFLGMLSLGAFAQQAQSPQPHMPMARQEHDMTTQVPAPAEPLKITFGDKSATWTVTTLASLPHVTVTVHNEHTKADETYSGVPLIALLAPLGVSEHPRGKELRLYVVAEGSDLYEVVYSSGEITPDVSSSTVIVADTENGKALAGDGPLKLVATGEKRPARWVRSLVAIRVFAAE
ncbi:MAG TPA: hypothetical protein VJX73_04015 [Terracidiphilus sp.]|nr:hypothetical protein [Terracidiphilus sp.]